MKYYKIFLLLIILPFLISCENTDDDNNHDDNDNCLTGSGETITETPAVNSFHSIAAGIEGNVYITQGSPQSLKIVTHPNVMEEIKYEVKNEVLEIEFDRCTSGIDKLDIFVTMEDIRSVVFSGVGKITSVNDLNVDNLKVVFSGVGEINLSGEAEDFDFILSGIGDLKAFDLTTSDCSIIISGLGNAEVTVNDKLDVIIAGNGNVYYKGHPTSITHNISGTGSFTDSN